MTHLSEHDLDELEGQIRGAYDLSHVRADDVISLITELRHLRVIASGNQGAIVNSIIERTRTEATDDEPSATEILDDTVSRTRFRALNGEPAYPDDMETIIGAAYRGEPSDEVPEPSAEKPDIEYRDSAESDNWVLAMSGASDRDIETARRENERLGWQKYRVLETEPHLEPSDNNKENTMCTFCGTESDSLITGSDGKTFACPDCLGSADE